MKNYRYIPIEKWSKSLNIGWDFNLKNPIYSPHRKETYYNEGTELIAGWVDLDELFGAITEMHQLRGDKAWGRDNDKINKAIEFWKNGGKMSPMLIDAFNNVDVLKTYPARDEITIRAGFHRFSVCCLIKLKEIPFLTPKSSQNDIEKLLKTVRWI